MRLLLFGIDGGSMRFVRKGVNEGRLPTLGKFMNEGSSGILQSVIPPITAPAWATCLTGRNPGKHGVFSFYDNGIDSLRPVNATDIKSETFPEILSRRGFKVGLVNVPLTYPIPKINGFVVSGMLTPTGRPYTDPPILQRELDQLGYKIEADADFPPGKEEALLDELLATQARKREGLLRLVENQEWDVLVYFYRETDMASHVFWRFQDSPDGQRPSPLHDAIMRVYEDADATLAQVMKKLDQETIVVVMSDHGFQGFSKMVHINNWMAQKGFLVFKTSWSTSLKRLAYRSSPDRYYKIIMRNKFLFKLLFNYAREGNRAILSSSDIDWTRTFAYTKVGGVSPLVSIGINPARKADRKAEARLVEELENLKDERGRNLVKNVWKSASLYHGPSFDSAPGVVVELMEGFSAYPHLTSGGPVVTPSLPTQSGIHEMEGIVMARGPGIRRGNDLNANIMDLAPTILHVLGVPVPADMDGRVIREIFEESSDTYNRAAKTEEPMTIGSTRSSGMSSEDEKNVLSHLKDLGYV
jgi:predicted AlkP superfamily phosphohydrolase/phosphomutase